MIPASFDIVGGKEKAVAIINLKNEISRKEKKELAKVIMNKHRNVKTVLEKKSPRSGVYRLSKYRLILGDKKTEVIHKENGCCFVIDPRKTYFSPREVTERQRVYSLVKEGEMVMVFFAGAGPYVVEIAKHAKPKKIVGIEINPKAVEYFKKNIKINKLNNTEAVLGDVKKKAKKYENIYDRVIMPLPETAIKYMKEAFLVLKKKGICHFYCFANDKELNDYKKRISIIAKKEKRKIKFIGEQKVLQWGPSVWKTRLDVLVLR